MDAFSVHCQFCWHSIEVGHVAGRLHGKHTTEGKFISAHHRCMQYASGLCQYKFKEFGGFNINEVEDEIARGQKLRCAICKNTKGKLSRGACCGCAVRSCRKSFHFTCANMDRVAITKRLVVRGNKADPTECVLYRVFCSEAHAQVFQKSMGDKITDFCGKDNSDSEAEEEETVVKPAAGASGSDATAASSSTSSRHTSTKISDSDGTTCSQSPDNMDTEESVLSSPVVSSSTSSLARKKQQSPRAQNVKAGGSKPRRSPVTDELKNQCHKCGCKRRLSQEETVENKSPNVPQAPSASPRKLMKTCDCTVVLQTLSDSATVPLKEKLLKVQKEMPNKAGTAGKKKTKVSEGMVSPVPPTKRSSSALATRGKRKSNQPESENTVHTSVDEVDTCASVSSQKTNGEEKNENSSVEAGNHEGVQSQKAGSSAVKSQSHSDAFHDKPDGQKGASRKQNISEPELAEDDMINRTRRFSNNTAEAQASLSDSVLLIPNKLDEYMRQEERLKTETSEQLKVAPKQLYLWQSLTLKDLPPGIILFFMMDLVKEMKNENYEDALEMLFDIEYLTSKADKYIIAEAMKTVGDEAMQQDMQKLIWKGLEQSVESVPAMHMLHGDNGLAVLTLDGRCFTLGHHITANIQAYQGLFAWSQDTSVLTFPMSPTVQQLAVCTEALALEVWLTRVNPVTQVTVLPTDDLLYDKRKYVPNSEFFQLTKNLKEKNQCLRARHEEAGIVFQRKLPLLVFQPMELLMVNFQEYFQAACNSVFETPELLGVLALLPINNLYANSWDVICALLQDPGQPTPRYRVALYSAFDPTTHPISMVLLEITQIKDMPMDTVVVDTALSFTQDINGVMTLVDGLQDSTASTDSVDTAQEQGLNTPSQQCGNPDVTQPKRKRGRPPKKLET